MSPIPDMSTRPVTESGRNAFGSGFIRAFGSAERFDQNSMANSTHALTGLDGSIGPSAALRAATTARAWSNRP